MMMPPFGSLAPGAGGAPAAPSSSPLMDMVMKMRQMYPGGAPGGSAQPGGQPPGQGYAVPPAFKPGLLNGMLGVNGPGQGLLNRALGIGGPPKPPPQPGPPMNILPPGADPNTVGGP